MEQTESRQRWKPRILKLPATLAAAVVGLVVGLLGVGLVWLGGRGCEAANGRPSCGGIGLLMLVLIVAAAIVLGMLLLRLLAVDNPGLVAFLGVVLPLIVIMLFLMDHIFSGWMVLAIPLLCLVCFAVSQVLVSSLEATEEGGGYADHTEAGEATAASVDDTDGETTDGDESPVLARYAPEDDQPTEGSNHQIGVGLLDDADETQVIDPDPRN